MTNNAASKEALRALVAPGMALVDAERQAPSTPGLYAVHSGSEVWTLLGLGDPPDDRPLYVGKSESSLADRDIRTHFADGRTGQSTLRRSFAALLAERLNLHARPRNPAKPERFANYGLSPEDDAKLTQWMRESLRLAFWANVGTTPLAVVEGELLRFWQPPLNLSGVSTQWTAQVKEARSRMANDARAWRP